MTKGGNPTSGCTYKGVPVGYPFLRKPTDNDMYWQSYDGRDVCCCDGWIGHWDIAWKHRLIDPLEPCPFCNRSEAVKWLARRMVHYHEYPDLRHAIPKARKLIRELQEWHLWGHEAPERL